MVLLAKVCCKWRVDLKRKVIDYKWPLLWAAALVCFVTAAWNPYIQYDESYTLSLIQHSVPEVVRITGLDVHPPLYYLLVKLFAAPFGGSIWAVRAFNLLPLLGMQFVGFTLVKKLYGRKAGWWFGVLSVFLPANMSYLLPEMRMYGLASFLVALAFLAGRILTAGRWDVLTEKKAWLLLFTAGILAAYTQYYALIAVALIYLWNGVILFRQKRENRKAWAACVGASAALYLPWLFVLLGQFGEVSEDYWIAPVTLRNLVSYIMFPVYSSMPVLAGAALVFCVLCVLAAEALGKIRKRKENIQKENIQKRDMRQESFHLLAYGLFVYGGMIGIGVAVSVLVNPVFSVRYVKCVLGILVLCMAWLFSALDRKKQLVLLLLFFTFGVCNLAAINSKNAKNREAYDWMMEYAKEHFEENTVLAYDSDGHYMGIFSYWFRQYPSVIPDECWKDEYEAFRPQLMTRSDYEGSRGNLRANGIWTVDVGNIWWNQEWDKQKWSHTEHCEPFFFYDQTDELQCMFTHLSGTGEENTAQ